MPSSSARPIKNLRSLQVSIPIRKGTFGPLKLSEAQRVNPPSPARASRSFFRNLNLKAKGAWRFRFAILALPNYLSLPAHAPPREPTPASPVIRVKRELSSALGHYRFRAFTMLGLRNAWESRAPTLTKFLKFCSTSKTRHLQFCGQQSSHCT